MMIRSLFLMIIDKKEYGVSIMPVVDSFDTPTFGSLQIQLAKVVRPR